jgi:hypothetical protein
MSYSHELSSVEARLEQYGAAEREAAALVPGAVELRAARGALREAADWLRRRKGPVCPHLAEVRIQPVFVQTGGGLACAACDTGGGLACDRCGRTGELTVQPVLATHVIIRVSLCLECVS